jgi:hypothetical protein
MNPLIADEWIYGVLSADATLQWLMAQRWYSDAIPEKAALPAGVYAMATAEDVAMFNAVIIADGFDYDIKVVGDTASYGDIEAAANRMHALLHGKTGTVTRGVVISCVREMPIRYTERDTQNGKTYKHLGGTYRIQVQ